MNAVVMLGFYILPPQLAPLLHSHQDARNGEGSSSMNFEGGAIMGFFLGFVLGVGCALAVMFSIYMGGYRKAVEESLLPERPARLVRALAKATAHLSHEQK